MPGLALYLTDFADAGVMVPVCATTAVTLVLLRQRRIAVSWVAVTAAVWALMLVLKLSFVLCDSLSCSLPPPSLGLVSPSGHVAASTAAYGGLLGLIFRSAGRSLRQSCLAAVVIAIVVGITRVVLHEHTVSEVVVGGIVGIGGAVLFIIASRGWLSGRRRAVLLGAVAASMLLFHGTHLTWEPAIHAMASSAARSIEAAR